MDELGYRVQRRNFGDFFFQEVFYGFNVMIGGALDGFDALSVLFAEFGDNFVKVSVCVGVKSRNFADFCTGC